MVLIAAFLFIFIYFTLSYCNKNYMCNYLVKDRNFIGWSSKKHIELLTKSLKIIY